nr:MAG TPA: hypothetical protein [Caudoviricetes sp.]
MFLQVRTMYASGYSLLMVNDSCLVINIKYFIPFI